MRKSAAGPRLAVGVVFQSTATAVQVDLGKFGASMRCAGSGALVTQPEGYGFLDRWRSRTTTRSNVAPLRWASGFSAIRLNLVTVPGTTADFGGQDPQAGRNLGVRSGELQV